MTKKIVKKPIPLKIKPPRQMAREDLHKIFKTHIGRKNKISGAELFHNVFGIEMKDIYELQLPLLMKALASAKNYCKRKTNCTIISEYHKDNDTGKGTYYYFVATTMEEATKYAALRNKVAKGNMKAGRRVIKSVKHKFYSRPNKW